MDNSSISLLASFATIKSLSDVSNYQSPYQVLSTFINHIIQSQNLYAFSSYQMKESLKTCFGFDIPEAVVKTALKKTAGVSLDKNMYSVSVSELQKDASFEEKQNEAYSTSDIITSALREYIQSRMGDADTRLESFQQGLIAFLVDDAFVPAEISDVIGEFVLKNERNAELQKALNDIKEGSILYLGLNYNIGETGSITKPLTLFLGTEVLFSLAGYNGEIYKQLADDFMSQVRAANSDGKKRIVLRYFDDVKREVDDFFSTAENIVNGRRTKYINKPAMIAITSGCASSSDVAVKKSDFYHTLQYHFGILQDEKKNYYDESLFSTNLESFDYDDDDDEKNRKKELGLKLISHINKLRLGERFSNDIDSENLLITNAKATLLISKEQTDRIKYEEGIETLANFAVSLDRITSLLWYKLGNGFGKKGNPTNISAVLRARVVLSASIARKATRAFIEAKNEYEAGKVTADKLAARIITLKNKPLLPEELQSDELDSILDFSPEYLTRFEEKIEADRSALAAKEELIEELSTRAQMDISDRDATIAAQDAIISEKNAELTRQSQNNENLLQENAQLRSSLVQYEQEKKRIKEKKDKVKNISLFILSIVWKLLCIAVVTLVAFLLERKYDSNIPMYVCVAVDLLGLGYTLYSSIKKDKDKYFPN